MTPTPSLPRTDGFRAACLLAALLLAGAGEAPRAQSLDALDDDPAVLTEAFVRGRLGSAAERAFTGEAAERPISRGRLPRAPRIAVEPLWRDSARALVGVEFSNAQTAEDLYVFADSTAAGWRIAAFRNFELPSVYYQQLDRYRNQGERSIREAYAATWARSRERGVSLAQHQAVHGTEDDRVFAVFNLRLASGSDRDLVRHFEFLRERFEGLRQNLSASPARALPLEHDDEAFGEELRYLLVKRAYRPAAGPVRFEVASIGGDDVGYLYCDDPDGACVPTPTPGGVIALRDLGGGWYLYRTT